MLTPFLTFKGKTETCLLNKSITHKTYLVPLLCLLINCMPAKSTPQMLSLKEEYFSFFKLFNNWFMKVTS